MSHRLESQAERDALNMECKQLKDDLNEIRFKLLWALSDVEEKDSTIKSLRKRLRDTKLKLSRAQNFITHLKL